MASGSRDLTDLKIYADGSIFGSGYWNAGRGQGRNWMGRLLELIRSEIAAQQASSLSRPS